MTPLNLSVRDIATIKIALGVCKMQFPDDARFSQVYKHVSQEFSHAVETADTRELIEASREPALLRRQV
jgi:hypothetical protein